MVQPLIRRPQGVGVPGGVPASSRDLGSASLVSVAFLGTNALAYAFTVLAARSLAPAAYGELAALLSVLLLGTVPASGVQTAAALVLGGGRGDRTLAISRLHATSLAVGIGMATLGLLAAVPVTALLHLHDASTALWLAALLVPHTLIAGYQGVLQGTGRYAPLALVTAVFGTVKLVGGTAGLLLGGTPTAALAGMTAGAALGAAAGWVGCGRPVLATGLRGPVTAALSASAALLGFVALLNLDVLLARHHLPAAASGEYAVAAIFAKVAFWLPQGVGVVLLPRLADPAHRRRLMPSALGLVGGIGALLTLATAALGKVALPLVGGSAYGASLGSATWMFTALGTLMALAQLLLYSGLAAAERSAGITVWLAAAAECVVVTVLAATDRLTVVSLAVTALATGAALVATGLLRVRSGRTAGETVPAAPDLQGS
jgi:hypothetical protein